MSSVRSITAEQARELVSYDPATGAITWKVRKFSRASGGVTVVGGLATSPHKTRHLYVCLLGTTILAHRLAWLIHYGVWPTLELDHKDGDGKNNRIENLREVSHTVNMQNLRKATSANRSTGVLGVSEHRPGKFTSYLHTGGKKKYLGIFNDVVSAQNANVQARREMLEGNTL